MFSISNEEIVKNPLFHDFLSELTSAEWSTVFVPVLAYWSYATFLHFGPKMFPTFFNRYKIDTSQPKRPPNRVTFGQVLYQVMFQHSMQMIVAIIILKFTRDPLTANVWESLEMMAIKLMIALFILDTWQYWWHRWMHTNRWLYKNFHSVHHRLTNNYSFGALYNHPIEGFLMDMVGSGLAGMLTFMTPWTATVFYTVATLKTVDDHCGFIWPWMRLIFSNNAAYHDIHHWGKGIKYNYSQPCFTFWDDFCGTRWLGSQDQSFDGLNKASSSEHDLGESDLGGSDVGGDVAGSDGSDDTLVLEKEKVVVVRRSARLGTPRTRG